MILYVKLKILNLLHEDFKVSIRSEFDDLKARIDLAALVGQSVELKKVGKNLSLIHISEPTRPY